VRSVLKDLEYGRSMGYRPGDMNAPPATPTLTVSYLGKKVALLHPHSPTYTFGSGEDASLRLGNGDDRERRVSRRAGSICWNDGVWIVYNDSRSRPFDIVVDGVPNPVYPRTSSDTRSMWALGPKPVKIQIAAGENRLHLVHLWADPMIHSRPPGPVDDSSEPTLPPYREPSRHDKLLLAAKFLALPEPGEALRSNEEAAQYAQAALPPDAEKVTKAAVAGVVYRWRSTFRDIGVQNVDDDSAFGRQLLAWGVISEEDRKLLRPWRDPGPHPESR
jgi:hypothetical protein